MHPGWGMRLPGGQWGKPRFRSRPYGWSELRIAATRGMGLPGICCGHVRGAHVRTCGLDAAIPA